MRARQLPLALMANLGYRFYAHHLHTLYTCDWPIGFAARPSLMRLTLVHPAIGRSRASTTSAPGRWSRCRSPRSPALTPPDVELAFYDDRMEAIPFDRPTDLVAIPVETYTAKRAYQIASEYRRRGVPVVMGGFHATLVPDEVARLRRSRGGRRGRGALAAGDRRRAARPAASRSTSAEQPARPRAGPLRPLALPRASATCPSGWSRPGAAATSRASSAPSRRFFERTAAPRPIDDIVAEICTR